MGRYTIIKSTVGFFHRVNLEPFLRCCFSNFPFTPTQLPRDVASFLPSHFFYCACHTCLLFFSSETKNLLYILFHIFLVLFLLPSLLRLVTLENSPAITPELLRLFQNMSALLGKHALDAFTVSVCK